MNIEKLYQSVYEDQMNSALQLICSELARQEYDIKIEGVEVTADDFDESTFIDFEKSSETFKIELFRNKIYEQKFFIRFTDFHDFVIFYKE